MSAKKGAPTKARKVAASDSAMQTQGERLIGAHMPTPGGLHKGLTAGKEIGCGAVQVFTANPRQWLHPPLDPSAVSAFRDARDATGRPFTCAHDSYLINLAAADTEILERSRRAFRREMDRAHELDLSWVVTHMGAHLNTGEDEALTRLIESLRMLLEETDAAHCRAGIALETTAGQGTGLGYRFDQLGRVLAGVGGHERLGICLDTCHIFAAGYDLRTRAAYDDTIVRFDELVGLSNLKVVHANDAKKPLGSRVDRHEHIGQGEIGLEAFRRLVTDARIAHVPVIVETPDADTMHAVNVARLRRLAANGASGAQVTVRLFGHLRDFAPEPFDLCLPAGALVRDVAAALAERDPRLACIGSHCRFAVADEYAPLDQLLTEGMTVAVMPPMSGG